MKKNVILAGPSGLVGQNVLQLLLQRSEIQKVYCLNRKPLGIKNEKLEEIIFDFNDMKAYQSLPKADAIFCCLGTTIKTAGSEEAFEKVDLIYPLELAKAAKNNNCHAFHVITAMGADANSSIFYNKVKGKLEEALKKLKFEKLYIYRPSLLLGDRKENRFGENVASFLMTNLSFLMQGSLKKYRAIKVEDVAKAMVFTEIQEINKSKTLLSDEIQAVADSYTS